MQLSVHQFIETLAEMGAETTILICAAALKIQGCKSIGLSIDDYELRWWIDHKIDQTVLDQWADDGGAKVL